jgi:trimethylamine--corrinoid protein Co-methyltransferase
VPVNKRHLDMVYSHIRYSDKPFMGSSRSRSAPRTPVTMARMVFGDNFVDRNCVLISLINANSPMVFDGTMLGALKVYARANQATIVTPFILAGAMSPVTVAGTLTQVLAEVLAGAALTQLCRPGAPVLFGCFASSISMQSGAPTFGTPEPTLVSYGAAQLARRLGIPFRTGGSLCASKVADAQAAYESANTLNSTVLAGTNFVLHAAGWLEGGLSSGYEKFVMDCDQLAMQQRFRTASTCRRTARRCPPSARSGREALSRLPAHAGQFRERFYRSTVADNNSYEQWLAEGEKTAEIRANAFMEEVAGRIRSAAARPGHRRGAARVHRSEEGVHAGRVCLTRRVIPIGHGNPTHPVHRHPIDWHNDLRDCGAASRLFAPFDTTRFRSAWLFEFFGLTGTKPRTVRLHGPSHSERLGVLVSA